MKIEVNISKGSLFVVIATLTVLIGIISVYATVRHEASDVYFSDDRDLQTAYTDDLAKIDSDFFQVGKYMMGNKFAKSGEGKVVILDTSGDWEGCYYYIRENDGAYPFGKSTCATSTYSTDCQRSSNLNEANSGKCCNHIQNNVNTLIAGYTDTILGYTYTASISNWVCTGTSNTVVSYDIVYS